MAGYQAANAAAVGNSSDSNNAEPTVAGNRRLPAPATPTQFSWPSNWIQSQTGSWFWRRPEIAPPAQQEYWLYERPGGGANEGKAIWAVFMLVDQDDGLPNFRMQFRAILDACQNPPPPY